MYKKYTSTHKGNNFIIEEDVPEVGWYLYVYENEVCVKDHLQDSLEIAQHQAFEDYGVPVASWIEASSIIG
ncbi:MAG: hypothetical protein OCD01_10440 [Fibrobacterales bacterium]